MKKIKMMMFCIFLYSISFIAQVNAESVFYKNANGIILNEQEYDFYSNFYWNGYQEYLTLDDHEKNKSMNIFDKEIEKKEIVTYSPIMERGSFVSNNSRTTEIKKNVFR